MEYRYQHFTARVAIDELRAIRGALAPGDPLPRFALPTADGGHFDVDAVIGHRPLLITLASFT